LGGERVDDTLKWGDIDTGAGKVWLRTTAGQTFAVIDPLSLAVLARIGPAKRSGALRYTPTGVWTSAHDKHMLTFWSDIASIGQ
jgi:virginiamycin B lyase